MNINEILRGHVDAQQGPTRAVRASAQIDVQQPPEMRKENRICLVIHSTLQPS